jgi:DNA-binding transcriptional LysR family regulator
MISAAAERDVMTAQRTRGSAAIRQQHVPDEIESLEHELGAPLFVRDSRHVTLTQAGRALLPAARRALTAADEARDAVAGIRGVLRGHLHVGAIQTLAVIDLPDLLTAFHRAHPGVTIRLSHDAAPVLASAAADAQLDIALSPRRYAATSARSPPPHTRPPAPRKPCSTCSPPTSAADTRQVARRRLEGELDAQRLATGRGYRSCPRTAWQR